MKRSLLIRRSAVFFFLLYSGLFLRGQQVVFSEDFSGFTTGTHTTPSTSDISGTLDSRTGIPGWTGSKVYSSGGEIKLGTASTNGWIVTPSVNLSQGELILKFDIACWPGDASTVQVYLNEAPVGDVITPAVDFRKVTIAVPAGSVSGKFKFTGLTKRFFLDNISIEKGNVSAVSTAGRSFERPFIYPNPASDYVKIENAGDFRRIEISDISGRLIRVIESSGNDISVISLERFSSGLYLIRFSSGRIIYTFRLIVDKGR